MFGANDGNDNLTAKEVAKRFRVKVRTVWRWKKKGLIDFVQPAGVGGAVRFPASCLRPTKAQQAAECSDVVLTSGTRGPKLSGRIPEWMDESKKP
jgi:excisionase family DNA binding protein